MYPIQARLFFFIPNSRDDDYMNNTDTKVLFLAELTYFAPEKIFFLDITIYFFKVCPHGTLGSSQAPEILSIVR